MDDVSKYVYLIDSDKLIVYLQETKKTTVNQVNLFFNQVENLANNNNFNIIIDLSHASPPNAEIRNEIKIRFSTIDHLIDSYSLIIGSNILLMVAAKFAMASLGIKNFKIYRKKDEAIEYIKKNES